MTKIQPAVSTILINVPANDFSYLDISQCASIANRRAYRQGLNWAVRGFRCNQKGGSTAGRFQIEKLPETWVMSNAWHKAFAMWNKQQRQAIDDAGAESAVAKFRDFKVFMDTVHVDSVLAGTNVNLPIKSGGGTFLDSTSGVALSAEWDYSQIVIPNADDTDPITGAQLDAAGNPIDIHPLEFYLHMVGANRTATSKGVIDGYASSRAVPQSPDPVAPPMGSADNWMRDMFDVGNDNSEVLSNATDRNDDLPYPQVFYPGADEMASVLQLHAHTDITATGTAVNNSFVMAGSQVPCGLLKFTNGTDQVMEVFIDLMPGTHRGYLCEPMQEF